MTVLDQLKKWKVSPPEPPKYDNGGEWYAIGAPVEGFVCSLYVEEQ